MKIFRIVLLILSLLSWSCLVLGQQGTSLDISNAFNIGGTKYYPSFTPLPTDLSVGYLGAIFGTVGSVLHGTSGQMLGHLFKVFNIGVLVVAGVVLIYTIIMTVLHSAHEGEFMGRKFNSAWIAVRTVMGLGLLVPSATTGYSTIQVIVMWVVVQGVGFANMAWYSALDYVKEGGQVYTPPVTDVSSMVNLAGTVLEMQVCMYNAQNVAQTQQKNQQQSQSEQPSQSGYSAAPTASQTVQNFRPYFTQITSKKDAKKYSVVMFPGNPYQNESEQDNACGQINFGPIATGDSGQDNKTNIIRAAVEQMMLTTNGYAQQIVNPSKSGESPNFPNQVQSAIVGAAADFINITLPIRAQVSESLSSTLEDVGRRMVEQGWIMAGRYYLILGGVNREVDDATSLKVTIDGVPAGFDSSSNEGAPISFNYKPRISASYITMDTNTIKTTGQTQAGLTQFSANDKAALVSDEDKAATYIVAATKTAAAVDQSNGLKLNYNVREGGTAHAIWNVLMQPIELGLNHIVGLMSQAVGDPIVVVQRIGLVFFGLAIILWLTGTATVFALATTASVLPGISPLGFSIQDAIITFIPTYTVFIITFFMLGATFGYYVPLIPFIIYVFSAVGWMIAVIEAMVAAPIVALGITHPEGNELLGKAEQAMMLLLSVFLRPVLMVIGLVAGMILSRVVLHFLNSGFFAIVYDVGAFNIFAFVIVLIMYCYLLVTVINQTFSLIYLVPDRVMRWLGVSEQTSGATEALQQAKEGLGQASGVFRETGQSMVTQATPRARAGYKRRMKAEAESQKNVGGQGES